VDDRLHRDGVVKISRARGSPGGKADEVIIIQRLVPGSLFMTSPSAAMKHHKLRIAFSAVCAVLCLLLIALWVRSHGWYDSIVGRFPPSIYFQLGSSPGTCWLELSTAELPGTRWTIHSQSRDEMEYMSQGLIPVPHTLVGEFGQKFDFHYGFSGTVGVPYWFAISLVAGVASLSCLRWQFRLRTLLIATTLVAVVLGLIAAASR
jgi:hypothetical protein